LFFLISLSYRFFLFAAIGVDGATRYPDQVARYWIFWFVFKVLGRLPLPALYLIANLMAGAAYRLAHGSRRSVIKNLRHVMPDASEPELERAARQVFRNVTLYYADLAYLPRMDTRRFFDERLKVYGIEELLRPALATGRGVVMLSVHFGNPEVVMQGLIPCGIQVFALTEPQNPRRLSLMMDELRRSKGHDFAPVSVGSVKRVIRTLRQGGAVALMGDRDIEGPRQLLPFCGEEAWMPTGPIEVALRTGAIVIPSFSYRRGRKFEAYMEEPLELKQTGDFEADARNGALEFLARFEPRLRAEPWQWMVLEPIWEEQGARDHTAETKGLSTRSG
jgi:KDO2-lipid IV(A) lauroyltransferase